MNFRLNPQKIEIASRLDDSFCFCLSPSFFLSLFLCCCWPHRSPSAVVCSNGAQRRYLQAKLRKGSIKVTYKWLISSNAQTHSWILKQMERGRRWVECLFIFPNREILRKTHDTAIPAASCMGVFLDPTVLFHFLFFFSFFFFFFDVSKSPSLCYCLTRWSPIFLCPFFLSFSLFIFIFFFKSAVPFPFPSPGI